MPKKQQWELLASEGHVLLARLDIYRKKINKHAMVAGAGILFATALSFPVGAIVGKYTGSAAGWVSELFSGFGAVEHVAEKAPKLKTLRVVVPRNFRATFDETANLQRDVIPEMNRVLDEINKGQKFEHCDFSREITENWADTGDISPRCRYSKDSNRLWVWSVVNNNNSLNGWIGLFRRADEKSAFKFYELTDAGFAESKNVSAMKLKFVPRTIEADFPELKVE